jgi:hypothetical protein
VLVVDSGGAAKLAAGAPAVAEFLGAGGRLLALGLAEEAASSFLPSPVRTRKAEHIASAFEPPGAGSPLAGVGPADVHNRDPREVPLVTGGAAVVVGNGVLARADDAGVVFCQLVPWEVSKVAHPEAQNVRRTFRRASFLVTRLLANLGAAGETPLLERFSTPVAAGERRWLCGFYLDEPEEWDDPYRFFRW